MATYRSIASTETDPQAPVTSALMKALQNNVLAIQEGDATAPKIQDAALDTGAATTAGVTWVRLRMADAVQGAVGTYALLGIAGGNTSTAFGATRAGSDLTPIGFSLDAGTTSMTTGGGVRAGTWRCMGNFFGTATAGANRSGTLWLRIA